jgi:hypothetical protein
LKGKRIKAEILIGIALLLIVSGAAGMMMHPDREADSVLQNRFGDVTWNHEIHARMKDISNCTTCHHTEKQGEMNPRPCSDCHKPGADRADILTADLFLPKELVKYEGENGPPARQSSHSSCVGCHEAMKQGPTECRDCHGQTFTGSFGQVQWDHTTHARRLDMNDTPGLDDNCISCHHKDSEAKTDGEFRPCSTCHEPAAQKSLPIATGIKKHEKAKHGECQSCHVEFNPEDKNQVCTDCHKGMMVDKEKTRPSLEQAVHDSCSSCHNNEYKELQPSMPAKCTDCHKPDPSFIQLSEKEAIVWDHKRHAEYSNDETTCVTCHHQDLEDGPKLACDSCHGSGNYQNPSYEAALEKQCVDCHKEKRVGLTSWDSLKSDRHKIPGYLKVEDENGMFWWDHRFHAVDISLTCQNCHHNTIQEDGEYATALHVGKDWSDANGGIQSCTNCHGPDGPVKGSVAEYTEAKSSDKAVEKVCTKCHQELKAGPQEWAEFFVTQPYIKGRLKN